ncbi:hypothetical protein [Singulisphaera sp. PoT]|uniref:hypothetical protein n=1 Tax=Singulisphaera sp. PoT TaxID=3411797 RepID=UPI003BF60E79
MSGNRPPKLPLVLLGLMTILTLAGPIAITLVIRGGQHRSWPPDRPIEWATLLVVVAVFVVLMSLCLGMGIAHWRRLVAAQPAKPTNDLPAS